MHIIHGAFCISVKSTSWDLKKILKAMWQIFHDSPARGDSYTRENHCDEFS